ncbi:ARPP-2 domain-containing protein [Actinomadura sp. 9N407]|uniref:ARPP-2 domain-containing protein n=1 Tax=Actinomadura sp. 9N407 TaxID=3375154 RepID=UPI0037B5850C
MNLSLDGLTTRPAQTWGSIRLVPLVRDEPVPNLRLHRRVYDDPSVVDVGDGTAYTAYIPHAFVATWQKDGEPAASYGTRMLVKDDQGTAPARMRIKVRRRMTRRVARDRLRFLPLHLAVEGYLALHFGGPEIAWEEWSQRALARGLSPRSEETYLGMYVQGLEDALGIFETYPGQCGVMVYVADALASAFVVPHPDDYRALHATLVQDLFGEQIYQYGLLTLPSDDMKVRIDGSGVRSLKDLRDQAARRQDEWAGFHDEVMAGGLFDPKGSSQHVQYLGGFTLDRFLPSFTPHQENHIGEAIVDDETGRIAYLKSFRLSEAQVRRGYLLTRLAASDWHLESAAAALGTGAAGLALRLERAGFGYLLRQDVLDHYRAKARAGNAR